MGPDRTNLRQHRYERSAEDRTPAQTLGGSMHLVESDSKWLQLLKSGCVPIACPRSQGMIYNKLRRPPSALAANLLDTVLLGPPGKRVDNGLERAAAFGQF